MPKDRAAPGLDPGKPYTFLARYGATILRGGIAAIPTALFTYQALLDLSPQEAWFISYILAHKWDEDLPYPSLRKMAERTGLSVRQLHRIKDAIVDKGYLQLVPRHRADDGGQDSNAYDFSGLFGRLEELLRSEGRETERRQAAPYADSAEPPAQTRMARAAAQLTTVVTVAAAPGTAETAGPPRPMSSGGMTSASSGAQTPASQGTRTRASGGAGTGSSPVPGTVTPAAAGTPKAVAPMPDVTPEKSPNEESPSETLKREDSNRLSPYILGVISDFSRELGDGQHAQANMMQAHHLWCASSLDEAAFVALLYEARTRTRRAQGAQGVGNLTNRAAYFFRVVRALLTEQD